MRETEAVQEEGAGRAVPAAAAARSCCSHTVPSCPASGFHVFAAAVAALTSAFSPLAGRTATERVSASEGHRPGRATGGWGVPPPFVLEHPVRGTALCITQVPYTVQALSSS